MFHRVSSDLVTVALWNADPAKPSPKILKIRHGGAFPPTHPTTRLCLELLQETLSAGIVSKVLDVGCGAGVLGLAAIALGAPLVVSFDIAGQAVRVTGENARENGLAGQLHVVQGSTECIKVRFDLVMANLPWEVQMDKAPDLTRLAAPTGALILSGFRDYQEPLVEELYQRLGWSLLRRHVRKFQHPELPPHLSFTWVACSLKRS